MDSSNNGKGISANKIIIVTDNRYYHKVEEGFCPRNDFHCLLTWKYKHHRCAQKSLGTPPPSVQCRQLSAPLSCPARREWLTLSISAPIPPTCQQCSPIFLWFQSWVMPRKQKKSLKQKIFIKIINRMNYWLLMRSFWCSTRDQDSAAATWFTSTMVRRVEPPSACLLLPHSSSSLPSSAAAMSFSPLPSPPFTTQIQHQRRGGTQRQRQKRRLWVLVLQAAVDDVRCGLVWFTGGVRVRAGAFSSYLDIHHDKNRIGR